ncbi:MAG: biotin transporter BioY [Clostridia bacterium]|nr:biotin transporter BioY [Clostridia bacterium]
MLKAKRLTLCAVLAAFICLLAPLSLPAGEIPLSLATFAVYLVACLTRPRYALTAVLLYLLLGAVGLPIFSGFSGGLQKLTGVTGGYLIGYLPCCAAVTLLIDRFEQRIIVWPLSMLLGTALCYACGTARFLLQTRMAPGAALAVCVLPFLPGDSLKIAVACAVGVPMRKRLRKFQDAS